MSLLTNSRRWIANLLTPPETRIRIVDREWYSITAAQWRSDSELCKVASGILANPDVRRMLAVVRNEHLGKLCVDARAPADLQLAFAHRAQGFGIALNTLESLAIPIQRRETPEATYSDTNWQVPDLPTTQTKK